MIKIIISFTKMVIAFLIACLFASCDLGLKSITGSGNVTTQNRSIAEDFTKIDAESGIDVIVGQSASKSVTVEADDNVQQHIVTKVENGTLKITSDYNNFVNVTKKVTVQLPVITGIEATSGVNLKSGTVLKSDEITIKSSSGSDVDVEVEADKIISESSSGSHLTMRGKALRLETSSSSGSSVDADKLMANEVEAESSSGSSIGVNPILSLDAKASSGGSINYSGSPKEVKRDESSGGSVSGK